jgi:hypothetical protein
VNRSRSNSASPISGAIGHVIPITLARFTYSQTAVLPTPVAARTSRTLSPSSCVSRSTSRIFLIDILIPAIGCPLWFFTGTADLLIRMSTGELPKRSSETVRNHRNAIRDGLE